MKDLKRKGLVCLIGSDLAKNAKMPLILLFAVLVSALLVVANIQRTRLLISEREELVLERTALDIEWRNLILEETALGDQSRIERIALNKFKMRHVEPSKEYLVIKKQNVIEYKNHLPDQAR